jgi:hypothetical protein
MAKARYRPAAPCDQWGNVHLTEAQARSERRLADEAVSYARAFVHADNKTEWQLGCTDPATSEEFVLCVEAARLLCAGAMGRPTAIRLLKIAVASLEEQERAVRKKRR